MSYGGNMSSQSSMSIPSAKAPPVDLMSVGVIPSNPTMDVESVIIRPIVNTDTFVRFQLDQRGFLSSQSRIQFQLQGVAGKKAFLPVGVGIMSLIRRAVLRGNNGAVVLQEIDDFNHYQSYESTFLDSEHLVEKEQFLTSRGLAHEVFYDDTATNVTTTNSQGEGIMIQDGLATENDGAVLRKPLAQYLRQDPIFSVSLADLFPIFRTTQLPTYAMQNLVIELTFEPSGSTAETRGRNVIRSGDTTNQNYPLDVAQTKMMADYLHYQPDEISAWEGSGALKGGKKIISYVDYRLTKTSYTHDKAVNLIRNLGGANRQINKIICGMCNDNDGETDLLNKYNAQWVSAGGSVELNVKYNDKFLFAGGDVDNNGRHYHNVTRTEGLPMQVTKEEYCNEITSLSTKSFEGYQLNQQLAGQLGWLAVALNRGEKVNQRGIEIFLKYKTLGDLGAGKSYTLRAWIECVRIAEIDVTGGTGQTQVYWA